MVFIHDGTSIVVKRMFEVCLFSVGHQAAWAAYYQQIYAAQAQAAQVQAQAQTGQGRSHSYIHGFSMLALF